MPHRDYRPGGSHRGAATGGQPQGGSHRGADIACTGAASLIARVHAMGAKAQGKQVVRLRSGCRYSESCLDDGQPKLITVSRDRVCEGCQWGRAVHVQARGVGQGFGGCRGCRRFPTFRAEMEALTQGRDGCPHAQPLCRQPCLVAGLDPAYPHRCAQRYHLRAAEGAPQPPCASTPRCPPALARCPAYPQAC